MSTATLDRPRTKRSTCQVPEAKLDWQRLVGKVVAADFDNGTHYVKVLKINAGPRSGLRSMRVAFSSYEGRHPDGRDRWGWNGARRTIKPDGINNVFAVIVRRKVIDIDTFLEAK